MAIFLFHLSTICVSLFWKRAVWYFPAENFCARDFLCLFHWLHQIKMKWNMTYWQWDQQTEIWLGLQLHLNFC